MAVQSLPRNTVWPWDWRAWLNNTTVTLGMNNVLDQDPPFVKGTPRVWQVTKTATTRGRANIRGRVWYVALKKRF